MNLSEPAVYLSLLVFLPVLAALVLALLPRLTDDAYKFITLAVTILVFLLSLGLLGGKLGVDFESGVAEMQNLFNLDWIPSLEFKYLMGIDGVSFPLVLLTTFLFVIAMGASWPINKHVKAYCFLFLLLETGVLGVFLSLDFFLFYVFWEVMLLPMYFLIGIWGGPRREYAAIKFFLYTLLGSVGMLIAILMLYFNSDLTRLDAQQLADAGIVAVEKGETVDQALENWTLGELPLAKKVCCLKAEADPTSTSSCTPSTSWPSNKWDNIPIYSTTKFSG